MNGPADTESIRRVLQQAAAAAFHRAQAQMENLNVQDPQNIRRLLEHAAAEAIARAQEFEIPVTIPTSIHDSAQAVEGAFVGLWPILKRILFIWTAAVTIVGSSMGMYGMFYLTIQPGQAASEPLYFDYSGIAKHPAPVCLNETLSDSETPLFQKEASQKAPWAVADFFSKNSQWEAYHLDVLPKQLTQKRILHEHRAYFFEIVLEVPESPVNQRTGMFMVHVDLQSSDGTRLASSVRATRLPHESLWISTVRKSIWLIPMMIGAVHETRKIVLPSFRHYVESSNMPLRFATVSLVMQDKHRPMREQPLEVTRGEIRIGKELTDFQFLLREWFFTCYVIGTIFFSVVQLFGLLIVRTLWNHRKRQLILRQVQGDDPSEGLDLDESELETNENGEWEDLPPQGQAPPAAATEQQQPAPSDAQAEGSVPERLDGPTPAEVAPATPSLNDEHAANMAYQDST